MWRKPLKNSRAGEVTQNFSPVLSNSMPLSEGRPSRRIIASMLNSTFLKGIETIILSMTIAFFPISSLLGKDVRQASRTVSKRYAAEVANNGTIKRGPLQRVRTEHFDRRGRLIRWEEREPKGDHRISWVGLYFGDERRPRRAAYWSGINRAPLSELIVTSPDQRISDVLYSDYGEKPRRQLRDYLDDSGREIYQEYFSPQTQRKYSEEIYSYDGEGNEIGRLWQRLDGRARKESRFEVTGKDTHGSWLERLVRIDGKLSNIDVREITYSDVVLKRPPAAAGPVTPSSIILPIPFAPGIVSSIDAGENMPSFTPDGRQVLFSRYREDWKKQKAMIAFWRDGEWREPEPVAFSDQVYNAAFRSDGLSVIYCKRDGDSGSGTVFVVSRINDGWSIPVNLTRKSGFTGSYFRWLNNGTLYFHRDGSLFRARLAEDGSVMPGEESLPALINTAKGTEFSPWVNEDEDLLLFTRGVDDSPEESGVFVSRRNEKVWVQPRRLPIPYGWGSVISPDGEDLVYVIDEDIFRVPLVLLGLRENN